MVLVHVVRRGGVFGGYVGEVGGGFHEDFLCVLTSGPEAKSEYVFHWKSGMFMDFFWVGRHERDL